MVLVFLKTKYNLIQNNLKFITIHKYKIIFFDKYILIYNIFSEQFDLYF